MVSAVDQTDGQVVLDAGQTIQAFYMSSSGGYTENNENVWGGTPIDYLRGVCDPGDYTTANPTPSGADAPRRRCHRRAQDGTVTKFTNSTGYPADHRSVRGLRGQASIGGAVRSSLSLPTTAG
jgi:SpoIID/LytB domain protein